MISTHIFNSLRFMANMFCHEDQTQVWLSIFKLTQYFRTWVTATHTNALTQFYYNLKLKILSDDLSSETATNNSEN